MWRAKSHAPSCHGCPFSSIKTLSAPPTLYCPPPGERLPLRLASGQILLADDLGQFEQVFAHVVAADGAVVAHQLDFLLREADGVGCRLRVGVVLEEERHRHAKELRRRSQPAGAQTVLAIFVFLHGLEADADGGTHFFLARPGEQARLAQPSADGMVDVVGATLARLAP